MTVATISVVVIGDGAEVPDASLPQADRSLPGNLAVVRGLVLIHARPLHRLEDGPARLLQLAPGLAQDRGPQLVVDAVPLPGLPRLRCALDEHVRLALVADLVMCLCRPLDDPALPARVLLLLAVAAALCSMRDANVRRQGGEHVLLRLTLLCL